MGSLVGSAAIFVTGMTIGTAFGAIYIFSLVVDTTTEFIFGEEAADER